MRRIHWFGPSTTSRAVCGRPNIAGWNRLRWSPNRRGVTCKACRRWLRMVYPRARSKPMRKLHFYNLATGFGPRCGMPRAEQYTIGHIRSVTCGRCKRLLGVRRPKKMRPNCELRHIKWPGQNVKVAEYTYPPRFVTE